MLASHMPPTASGRLRYLSLDDVYPDSTQTRLLGFARAADPEIWFHARTHDFVIVSKDNDFAAGNTAPLAAEVVWLLIGNRGSAAVERLLCQNLSVVAQFVEDPERVV